MGRSWAWIFLIILSLIFVKFLLPNEWLNEEYPQSINRAPAGELTKSDLAEALGETGAVLEFPNELELSIRGRLTPVVVSYTFDTGLDEQMKQLIRTYRPDYGAFVAMDATTGRVLSMVSYSQKEAEAKENLTLRATFPSASVFKVVTAAAAIAEGNFSANTVIPFNGSNHTLYKKNVFNETQNKWTRFITLKDAFAKSVNTVFGRIGVFSVGPDHLRNYADRFGFNREITADVPIDPGKALITDDPWELAEAASGYTRENTMSPLQAALIAAAIVNDGVMMEPYVVQSVKTQSGSEIYSAQAKAATQSVDAKTAAEIRSLMQETITRGTSTRYFRGFFKGELSNVSVGGKTGSLTGSDPPGKYDWFVGYAEKDDRQIAIAALTVHQKVWRVKSSYLARRAIELHFKDKNPKQTKQ